MVIFFLDIAAQIVGSVGLQDLLILSEECAMLEAIHGSAPDEQVDKISKPSDY
jgi:isocitrate dehydrogenase